MKSLAVFSQLDAFTVNRLLRRESIDRLSRIIKIAAVVLALILAVIGIRFAIQDSLQAQNDKRELENAVQSRLSIVSGNREKQNIVRLDYDTITKHKIFGEIGLEMPVAEKKVEQPKVSNVALKLIGTFLTSGEDPYAIIENTKQAGTQEIFAVNEQIFDAAKLVAVYSDKVEINRDGEIEILQLDEIGGTGESDSSDEGNIIVNEKELDDALANLPLLLTQARAVPYFKDGKSIGLRLFAIRRESLFEKIGLKNGDILKTINGNNMGDITQAVKLFEKLKEERNISVTLERQRQDQTFKYQIR